MKRINIAVLGVLSLVCFFAGVFWMKRGSIQFSVLGGEDGPTSVFFAGSLGNNMIAAAFMAGAVLLAIILLLFRKKGKQ
ncbi:MAG: hypothetical protein K2M46_07075 [Lachnospiraceae bacterium]|nr:hypothetical protein [Lachnospiraceae bacterium]